jgi:monoamine oxidase
LERAEKVDKPRKEIESASVMSSIVRLLNPPSLADTKPTYSHVSTVESQAKLVYTAGQIGCDRDGKVAEGLEAQIKQALENLAICLNSAGASVKDLVKITFYIVNYDPQYRPHSKLLMDFLKGHRPPSTLVPVPALARSELLFEIEAVAAIPFSRSGQQSINQVPSQQPHKVDSDVIVIGGGLSGLQAAYNVQKAGLSCIVLEARDRVGGKVWSRSATKGSGWVDLGAAWINDTNQSEAWALGKMLKLEFVEQLTEGACILHDGQAQRSLFPYGEIPNVSARNSTISVPS